jgi:hypothetical protein
MNTDGAQLRPLDTLAAYPESDSSPGGKWVYVLGHCTNSKIHGYIKMRDWGVNWNASHVRAHTHATNISQKTDFSSF